MPDGFGEGNVNQHVCIIRPAAKLNYKFLTYCLSAPWGQDQVFSSFTGASRQGLGQRDLGAIQVPLPPLPEQKRIAAYLDASCTAIDAAVTTKRRQLETLDELRKETITHAITRGLKPNTRTKASGEDWLGEIPAHWSAPSLKRLLREPLTYGLNESAELEERDLPRYLRITDFDDDGKLRDDTFRSLPREIAREAFLNPAQSGNGLYEALIAPDAVGNASPIDPVTSRTWAAAVLYTWETQLHLELPAHLRLGLRKLVREINTTML